MTSTLFGALASAPSGESVHQVYQTEENTLIEKTFTNEQWSLPKILGPAKAGTTAAACFLGPKGVIVSLDEKGVLQDHVYDPDEEEWEDGSLSSLVVKAHPESKIAMTIHNGVVHLYHQSPSGAILETTCDPLLVWAPSKELSVPKPVAGAGFCVASTDDSLCLSYFHQDGSLHRSTYQNGDWTDKSLGNTPDGAPPVRILALLSTASICYSTKSGDLMGVDDAGTHQKLGDISQDGEVQTFGGKECLAIGASLGLSFGFGIGASINIGGGCNRPNYGYNGGFNGGFNSGGGWAPTPGLDGLQSLLNALQYGRPGPRYMV